MHLWKQHILLAIGVQTEAEYWKICVSGFYEIAPRWRQRADFPVKEWSIVQTPVIQQLWNVKYLVSFSLWGVRGSTLLVSLLQAVRSLVRFRMGSLWDYSLTYSFRPHCGPGVGSASDRNEYQGSSLGGKDGRSLGLTSRCLHVALACKRCESEPRGILGAYLGLYRDSFSLPFFILYKMQV